VDELLSNGGLSEGYRQQLARAEQAADEAKAGLAALEGRLAASVAVAEAQVHIHVCGASLDMWAGADRLYDMPAQPAH
jgi:hypothetical protein